MCNESVLVPIPDLLWENGGIYQFKTDHPEYGIDGQGRKCLAIDACIAPAVKHLWDAGIVTLSCCCGHGDPWGVITVQTQQGVGQRGAMTLRVERYEELLSAEASAAQARQRVEALERYARSLEDEIVFRLQGELAMLNEDDERSEAPDLRAKAGEALRAAEKRWDGLFNSGPHALAAPTSPADGGAGTHPYDGVCLSRLHPDCACEARLKGMRCGKGYDHPIHSERAAGSPDASAAVEAPCTDQP